MNLENLVLLSFWISVWPGQSGGLLFKRLIRGSVMISSIRTERFSSACRVPPKLFNLLIGARNPLKNRKNRTCCEGKEGDTRPLYSSTRRYCLLFSSRLLFKCDNNPLMLIKNKCMVQPPNRNWFHFICSIITTCLTTWHVSIKTQICRLLSA